MSNRQLKNALPGFVESYFQEHLRRVCGASPHTIRAYRDTLRLLLIYVSDTKPCAVTEIQTTDLHVNRIKNFLSHLESQRSNKAVSRNCRLAAIRGFFKHLLRGDPEHSEQYHKVLSIPSKKTRYPTASYLEPEDVQLLMRQPDRRTVLGRRNHALLLFLYNTGARVSEALSVRIRDLQLTKPAQVRLHGKGNKERLCPLWPETVKVLRTLEPLCSGGPSDILFLNARRQPLSRDGVAYILGKCAISASKKRPSLKPIRITPHVLRHSCAVALLQSGVDITVIRDYLGHASVSTTSKYITTNLKMKRDALESFWETAGIEPAKSTAWNLKPDVLAFLESL